MPLPVKQAIEKLKTEKDLSYRQLDYKTGIPAQNLNSIAKGTLKAPKKMDFYEKLANAFQVEPIYFQEYVILLAIDKVKNDPTLAQSIIEGKPKDDLIIYAKDPVQKIMLEAYRDGLEKNRADIAEKENRSSA